MNETVFGNGVPVVAEFLPARQESENPQALVKLGPKVPQQALMQEVHVDRNSDGTIRRVRHLMVRKGAGTEQTFEGQELNLMQFTLMDDMARSLRSIQESQEREKFRGELDEKTLNCTSTVAVKDMRRERPYTAWHKAIFYNSGPESAYISINNAFDWKEVLKNDTYEVDFSKADRRIEVIYYKCDAGETASVVATGKW